MKLKELLLKRFIGPNDQFTKLELEPLKEELLECDEFLGCEEINFMEAPIEIINDSTYVAQTMKIGNDTEFVGTPYIYNISFTPEIYDPNSVHKPVKDGAAITPLLYNPTTFEPSRKIVLQFNPEGLMDETSDETKKQEIRDLLEKVLQNPKEYVIKGERGIMVRGVFETEKP